MMTRKDDHGMVRRDVTWRPRPLVTFYQMTFPVDWVKAKLTEDPNQGEDGDAGPEDPDGEEDVEDRPGEDKTERSNNSQSALPPLLNFVAPQVVPGDAGGQGCQGTEIHIGCKETQ